MQPRWLYKGSINHCLSIGEMNVCSYSLVITRRDTVSAIINCHIGLTWGRMASGIRKETCCKEVIKLIYRYKLLAIAVRRKVRERYLTLSAVMLSLDITPRNASTTNVGHVYLMSTKT